MAEESRAGTDFIRRIVLDDLASGKHREIVTRFPPEPNGYLHIGHAKAICLNFGLALEHGGRCHLRYDDTNPSKEEVEYVESMQRDIRWLGFDWGPHLYHASDYFPKLYDFALELCRRGKAYVCDLSAEEMRAARGTLTEPGRDSPHRNRSVAENLDLLERMRKGEFPDGARTLRAKIDMASGNITLRDPVLYRIQRSHHHRTGDAWCIYPMYDWAHPLSDAIEGITHSICTLEFEDHRPLYDWVIEALEYPVHPQQIEFARLNLSHTVMSKRILRQLVLERLVSGWDDPRMPTLSAMRRRGYPPAAIRSFCNGVGVARRANVIELARLEHEVREELNRTSPRVMAVLRPLRLVIENFPEGQVEWFDAVNNPEDPSAGTRRVPFTRELWIERDDFREDPPRKFFRLAPGREVRLRAAYLVTCREVVKDPHTGEVVELRCAIDLASRGGEAPDGRKVKSTIHWVSAAHALPASVRLYEPLFSEAEPGDDWRAKLNPASLEVLEKCLVEPSLASVVPGQRVQFERQGYFCVDPDSRPGAPVFNRSVGLRDTWARLERRGED